jgi:hypothetical protein
VQVLARGSTPLLSPTEPWAQGVSPYTCNVANVIFLEAAAATEEPDTFRVRAALARVVLVLILASDGVVLVRVVV